MSLEPESRLGPYLILDRLGAGGMGEVYRARDTRVGREVAVKILPPSFASSPDRVQRFELEARAAAALNHPNLLTVHDVGSVEGTAYIVTELLDGQTLRERTVDRIPVRKAVEWAGGIATGLAAAHDRGVVHRDLKPENVVITSDGRVKILDFGLAKLTSAFQEESPEAQTEARNTSPGTVMGTAGYMSPEQVRGQNVDQRTDVFSLGAILYEMLSGRRAFHGDSPADTMSAVLREDPPELPADGTGIPSGLERIVRRCLEKNPAERFHSARDVAFALEAISGSSTRSMPAAAIPGRAWRLRPAAAAVGALALAAGAFLAGRSASKPAATLTGATPAAPARLVQLTDQTGAEGFPSISPDGASIVFLAMAGGEEDLFLQRVGGGNPLNLTHSPESEGPAAFSPDGSRIAFTRDGGIWIMGASGESVRRLTSRGFFPSWAPDGNSIVYSTKPNRDPFAAGGLGELWRVDTVSGESRKIDVGTSDATQPSCSPDGKWIAFWGLKAGTARRVIFLVPAAGGKASALIDDGFVNWNPVWTPDGHAILYSSDRAGSMNLWRLPIDTATGKQTGPPEPLTISPNWNAPLSIAKNGTIAFASRSWSYTVTRRQVDLRGRHLGDPTVVMGRTSSLFLPDPSPDGRSIAVTVADPDEDVLVLSVDDPSRQVRLTNDRFRDRGPRWSADGSRIFFFSDRSGKYETWSARVDGSDLRQEARGGLILPDPSPDGRALLTTELQNEGRDAAVWDLTAEYKDRTPEVLPGIRPGVEFHPQVWSPDGARIFGVDRPHDKSPPTAIFAWTLATKRYEEVFHGEPGSLVAVVPDGSAILRRRGDTLESVDLRTKAVRVLGILPPETFDLRMTRDGTTLFAASGTEQSDIWLLVPGGEAKPALVQATPR